MIFSSARYANADHDGAVAETEQGAVAVSLVDTPALWAKLTQSGIEIAPYVPPPTPVPTPTRRQLRLWLIQNGHSLSAVDAAIAQLPEPARSVAVIEWEDASFYRPDHPTLLAIAAALGVPDVELAAREAALL